MVEGKERPIDAHNRHSAQDASETRKETQALATALADRPKKTKTLHSGKWRWEKRSRPHASIDTGHFIPRQPAARR
jgi:hypothetical protein